MRLPEVIKLLRELDKIGRFVFSKQELQLIFCNDHAKAFTATLTRLVKANILTRACHRVYVNPNALSIDSYIIEHIAKALRPKSFNYVSLESMLSEYGVISQIPVDRITIMTTGRGRVHTTPYGVIEYTHTKRLKDNLINGTIPVEGRPLLVASKLTAWRDLKRVGRNLHLVNLKELEEE